MDRKTVNICPVARVHTSAAFGKQHLVLCAKDGWFERFAVRCIASLLVTLFVFCGTSCSSWTIKRNTQFLLISNTFCMVNTNTHSYRFSSGATSSLPPAFTCSMCQMFSYSSASFSDNGTCNKYMSF